MLIEAPKTTKEAPVAQTRPPRKRRTISRDRISLLALLPLLLISCVGTSGRSKQRHFQTRGEEQLLHKQISAAANSFSEARARATTGEAEARALLGLGRCRLAQGHADKSLDLLYKARRLHPHGATGTAIEKAMGEAYFENRSYGRAYAPLRKVLDKITGTERDLTLLRLAICARESGSDELARRYRDRIQDLAAPAIQALGARHRPKRNVVSRSPRADRSVQLEMTQKTRHATDSKLRVLSRSRWNPRPTGRNVRPMGRTQRITVHHTGGPSVAWSSSYRDTASEIRAIQKVHQSERHWADIGYHYIIDRAGRIWEGRALKYQGAHAGGQGNIGNIGIVLMGNFLRQKPSEDQTQALQGFLTLLCRRYRIPSHRVYTHSEIRKGTTSCPGPVITRLVHSFRRQDLASTRN